MIAGKSLALGGGTDSMGFLATLYSEPTTHDCVHKNLPIGFVSDKHSLLDAVKSTKSVKEKRLCLEIKSITCC